MNKYIHYLVCFVFFLAFQPVKAQVVINEYSAANFSTITDNFGDTPDWIELYNAGGSAVNLSNYFLSDKITNPLKWQLPNINMNPGQRIIFWASNRNTIIGIDYHTNFKITQSEGSDIISLADNMANILDLVNVAPNQRNQSTGRTADGGATWGVFATPTPGTTNTGSFIQYATKPIMSMAPGNYGGPIAVNLTTPDPGITIRYTTNGSEPTAASTAYAGPIAVNATTVIRAKAFSSNAAILPSFIETNTYFINVNHTIPIISICSEDYNNLFNNIMAEIYSTLEYFDANEVFQFETYGEVNGHGNDSWAFPQKGVDFITKDEEGYDNEMDYAIFDGTSRPSYQRLIIKAGASDNYPFAWGPGAHVRDAFVQSYAFKSGLNLDGRRFESCIVYLNGQYWGLYELREKASDSDYTDYYYGQQENEIDVLSYWGGMNVRYGSTTDWNNFYNYVMTNSMAVQSNYNTAAAWIDVSSVIDNYIYNTYVVNSDWINWNTMWWRGFGSPAVKWKYIMWDMDNVYDLGQNYSGWPNGTGFGNDPCDLDAIFQNAGANMGHMDIFNALMNNNGFRNQFVTRYAELISGPLTCPPINAHLDSIVNVLTPEMPGQIARWGGSMAGWQNNLQHLRDEINGRCTIITQGAIDCYGVTGPYDVVVLVDPPLSGNVTFMGNALTTYPWSGTYFGTTVIDMQAAAAMGWNFDYWELSNHVVAPNQYTTDVTFTLNSNDTIIAHFKQPDSLKVMYKVMPVLTGQINTNGYTIPAYPYTDNVAAGDVYNLSAIPSVDYKFDHWELNNHTINPSATDSTGSITIVQSDTVIAWFIKKPPIPEPYEEPPTLYIPNSFTPNDDELNQYWQIYFNDHITDVKVEVFDRWGIRLFYSSDKFFKWDGTYSGQPLEMGVYAYKLRYTDDDKKVEQTLYGHVTLLR
jgi:gliding motility-associated-like protein